MAGIKTPQNETLQRIPRGIAVLGVGIACFSLYGCAVGEGVNALIHTGSGSFERANRQRQIERVVRDFCLSIRAVGIIPQYPLREDVEPGKMFIVTTPIEELKKLWNRNGYLPIEREFDQLADLPYSDWYRGAFGVASRMKTPENWRAPVQSGDGVATNWSKAPISGLVSYSYQIRRGEGATGAMPIQGIPVMMSALGARNATVSVSLDKVFTYGVGEIGLRRALLKWEGKAENRRWLAQYPPVDKRPKWLRVISRVYLVKTVTVNVTNDSASSAQLSAGAPKPVQNLFIAQGDAAANFQAAAQTHSHSLADAPTAQAPSALAETAPSEAASQPTVGDGDLARRKQELELATRESNLALQDAKIREQNLKIQELERKAEVAAAASRFGGTVVPGMTARITSASAYSISMQETFERPIVVGYEAIDFPINYPNEDGEAGLLPTPISTFFRMKSTKLERWEDMEGSQQ